MKVLGVDIERGDLVVVTLKDSRVFRGVFFDYDYWYDTFSEVDELCIRDVAPSRSLKIPDILSIEKVA